MVGRQQRRKSYRLFVEKGVDDETQIFYDKKKFPAVMGSDDFRESIHFWLPANAEIPAIKALRTAPSISMIINAVSVIFATPEKEILQTARGPGMKNPARSAAIYCCRKMAGLPMNEIAKQFGFSHYGSVSGSIAKFDRQINKDPHLAKLMRKVDNIIHKKT